MTQTIGAIDVIVAPPPVVSVASVGVQGPPGEDGAPGPPGPAGPQGPAGTAGIHASTHYVGGSDALAGSLAATDVRVGTNPAQSGGVRLANNQSITARNAANTADLIVARLGTDDGVTVGPDATYISIPVQQFVGTVYASGSVANNPGETADIGTAANKWRAGHFGTSVNVGTNPAQSGAVRLANSGFVMARNGANTADVYLIYLDGGNICSIGYQAAQINLNAYTAISVGVASPQAAIGTSVSVGTNPAQSGAVRLANNQSLTARNAANTADHVLAKVNSTDQIELGAAGREVVTDGILQARNRLDLFGQVLWRTETVDPGAAPANMAYLWLADNGSGKSRLMVRFATGAAVQIAIEP